MMKNKYMEIALNEAYIASQKGEVPIGVVIINDKGKIITKKHNQDINLTTPLAHAEMLAINDACKILGKRRLDNYEIYVTLEPCAMCASAISFARFKRLYFGAFDKKYGSIENGARIFSHNNAYYIPEIYGGIMEEESTAILKNFFTNIREKSRNRNIY